jgi:hypothetical protein
MSRPIRQREASRRARFYPEIPVNARGIENGRRTGILRSESRRDVLGDVLAVGTVCVECVPGRQAADDGQTADGLPGNPIVYQAYAGIGRRRWAMAGGGV